MNGAREQSNFSSDYGEDMTGAYAVFNANASYSLLFENNKLILKSGVENMFDTYYSTYADWNNIPRMGRNIFLNISFVIQ